MISLIVPARNEAPALPLLAARVPACVDQVMLVDNGSTDGTAQVARALGFDCVDEPRIGYGAAVWTGCQAAKGDILVFASADGSDPVEAVGDLVSALERGADLALAVRQPEAGAMGLTQRWGNALACRLIQMRWGVRFDDLGPFRALRRETLAALNMEDRGFGWTMEMQARAAARRFTVAQIPLPYGRRQAGRSKISGTLRGTVRASVQILWTFARLALKRRL